MRDEGATGTVECPSCRSLLTAGLRFCRHCGYRLGEGVEEYAETRRFDGTMPTGFAPGPSAQQAQTPGQWGAMAPMPLVQPLEPVKPASFGRACRRLGSSWVMWMVLVLAVLTAGGVITNGIWGGRGSRADRVATPKSYLEVDGFETADGGGAFIDGLKTSNTSLERAGLRGGDIITSWDGKPIANERAITRALAATPVGKTVKVGYRRDGVTGETELTTISDRDFRDTLAERPEGRGFLGVEGGGMERVHVPSTNTHGVELTDVQKNRPGYIAGLREGDVVLEFNGKPVSTPGDLRLRIYEALPDSVVEVLLVRGGQQVKIPVKMGSR